MTTIRYIDYISFIWYNSVWIMSLDVVHLRQIGRPMKTLFRWYDLHIVRSKWNMWLTDKVNGYLASLPDPD